MNKEKLKKVFSFIGKLVLLVLLTFSAIASTIGCFNSLKKNINDTPNKVQEVKRANIVIHNSLDNIFVSPVRYTSYYPFDATWNTSPGISYYGYQQYYNRSAFGFASGDILDIGQTYLVHVSFSNSRANINNVYAIDSFSTNYNTMTNINNKVNNSIFSKASHNELSFLFTPTNNNYIGLIFDCDSTNGYNTYFFVYDFYVIPYVDSSNAYDSGYSIGYSQGYDVGNSEGYEYGYSVGEGYVQSHPHNYDLYTKDEYDNAYDSGYDVGVMESYDVGYNAGYGAGATDVVNRELAENGFIKLANIVFNAPYNILHNTFNFEFLGINLWALMSFVFTIALVFGVIGFLKRR